MAVFEGKLVTCNLCGESIFIKRTGVQELSNAVIDAEIERINGEHGGDQGRAASTSD